MPTSASAPCSTATPWTGPHRQWQGWSGGCWIATVRKSPGPPHSCATPPGSRFERHSHGGGEEILVLEGTFSDEQGDYPAGTYLRNPIGSNHAPSSEQGCTILVKLQQMHPADQQRLVIDTSKSSWVPGLVSGLEVLPLHAFGSEHVALVRWAPGTVFQPHGHPGGEEIFVLDGVFQDEHGTYPAGSWLRNPPGSVHRPWSEMGCTIWVKTGHLPATQGPDGSEA